jgi:hypothetical protein
MVGAAVVEDVAVEAGDGRDWLVAGGRWLGNFDRPLNSQATSH